MAELEFLEGQKYFMEAIFDSENLDVDGLYDALDCCGNAQKMAFELKDTELEAHSEAYIGRIYFKGLRKFSQAKKHMTNSILLEKTLRPRDCSGESWFQLCKQHLQAVQELLQKAEQDKID